jgi:hypothetical protein
MATAGQHDRQHRDESEKQPGLFSRLGWFIGLWVASVAVLGVIAYTIRFWLGLD